MKNKERILSIIDRLNQFYKPVMSLTFTNPWELLVATILSAQSRDERVNLITQKLFKEFPSIQAFADSSIEDIEKAIASINYYRTKAKHIHETAVIIMREHSGNVPDTMESLTSLPGVARKTANVVLNIAFQQSVGIVVDTHVLRLSNRLGFVHTMDRDQAERELMNCIPKKDWIAISLLLIHHGRKQCMAKKPLCSECCLHDLCPTHSMNG